MNRMRFDWRSPAIAALVTIIMTTGADAQSLWSVAGSFNDWRTDDPDWTMSPVDPARPDGTISVDNFFDVGRYEFKFVRDGAWENGHLGATNRPSMLTEPGENIRLTIKAPAIYAFYLSPSSNRWQLRVKEIDEPVLIVRMRGVPQALNYVTLDYSQSVVQGDLRGADATIGTGTSPIRTAVVESGAHEYQLRPEKPGAYTITIGLRSGGAYVEEEIELEVVPFMQARWVVKDAQAIPEQIILEPQSQTTFRTIVEFFQPEILNAFQVEIGDRVAAHQDDYAIEPGHYMIEVEGSEVTLHDENDGTPAFLHKGNWRRFVYVPDQYVDRVHLVGDFNDWAGPDEPGSIELFAQWDGTYSQIIELPEGEHRYQFLIDGAYKEHDRDNPDTVRDEEGDLMSVTVVGRLPAEFAPVMPGHINLDGVRHDPALARDFNPISQGLGLADVNVRALPGDIIGAHLEVESIGSDAMGQASIPMSRTIDSLGFDRWSTRAMPGYGEWRYRVVLQDGPAEETIGPFDVTIDPAFETPDWAKGTVWYQIFAERFRNGNPENDPHGADVYAMPWHADWYTISAEEEAAWRQRFDVPTSEPFPPKQGGPLYHVVWDRRYGGDLQGVLEQLDHLVELGVGAIYFNPVFEAESMHKYDATDFRHIDDNFANPASAGPVPEQWSLPEGEGVDPSTWTWTQADRFFIDEFLPACKARGIRVVIDGVFNHTGRPFFAFRDVVANGADSSFRDWYMGQFDADGALVDYVSWDGGGALPKFNQKDDRDLVEPVKQHIFAVTKRWMDPNGDGNPSDGIDGWRLDVALDVGLPFWTDWYDLVKGINPEAMIVAEIWSDADAYTRGNYFDTTMHYPFAKAVVDWLGMRPGMTSGELRAQLDASFDDAPQTMLVHQNLFGSHDTDRFVSMLQNPNRRYDEGNRPQDHRYPYNDSPPSERTYRLSLLGMAIQATYIGAPMIYYGDELGMWGADDPTDRKPVPWPDLGSMDNPAENARLDVLAQYTHWFNLRNDKSIGNILRYGSLRHVDAGDERVFAFERELSGRRVLVVANRSDRAFDASGLGAPESDGGVAALSARYWELE